MKIHIKESDTNKSVWLSVHVSNRDDIVLKEQFYKAVLFSRLNGSKVSLVTITPQSYSLGYEILPNKLRKIRNASFLINSIPDFNFDLANKIVLSEEFERSLLIIVKKEDSLSDAELCKVIKIIKNESIVIKEEIIFCEDDGDSLCIYNSNITLSELKQIACSITQEMKIEVD